MDAPIEQISVEIGVGLPLEKVWQLWTNPADIMQWNNFAPEWHCPRAENDLRPGGTFLFVMALKDGSFQFDFTGVYDEVITNQLITYTLNDNRRARITFTPGDLVKITETFDPNKNDPAEMQESYCKAVLTSFKLYAERW